MQLAILGSGTAIPHPRRGASGYALMAPSGEVLLLECGPGSTRRWPRFGITFERACTIVTSHYHVDHCGDLPAVLFGRNVIEPSLSRPLTLFGPVGHRAHIAGIEALYGQAVGGHREIVEMRDRDVHTCGSFTVEAREVLHVAGALGFRIRCGERTLAFSGDSGICDALVELCRGVDLALLECSYPASRETSKHLNARTAGEAAARAGLEHVVLTHFYPVCDGVDIEAEVREAGYRGELVLAEDDMLIDV